MAISAFLKFDGFEGSSTVKGQEGKIEVQSWAHHFSQPTTAVKSSSGGGTVEMANHGALSFSKMVDESTAYFLQHCWNGKYIATGQMVMFRSNGSGDNVDYLTIELEDIVVSDYSISVSEGGLPIEQIAVTYGKITYIYKGMDAAGNITGNYPISHDLRTNEVG